MQASESHNVEQVFIEDEVSVLKTDFVMNLVEVETVVCEEDAEEMHVSEIYLEAGIN